MKKLIIIPVLFSISLLVSCNSTNTNPIQTINTINQRAAIFIIRGVSTGVCESYLFKTALDKALVGVITHEGAKNTSCSNFGDRKNNRNNGCYSENYPLNPGNLACIIGYNGVKNNSENLPILNSYITGTILDIFIRLAEQ